MAFYREYDFREAEDVLVEYFFLDPSFKRPQLILRLNVKTHEFSCKPLPWLSITYITEEIRRLFDLLDTPHWKSFVRTCSIEHRFKDISIF